MVQVLSGIVSELITTVVRVVYYDVIITYIEVSIALSTLCMAGFSNYNNVVDNILYYI